MDEPRKPVDCGTGTVRRFDLALLALSAVACVAIALAHGFPRPYPVLTDLDSSFVAFLAIAEERGWRAGIDYVFTYGPLGSWFMPIGFGDRLLGGAAVRMASAAVVAGYLWSQAPGAKGAVLAVGALYLICMDANAALLAVALVLAFALPGRGLGFVIPVAILAALWGLMKFSGLVASALTVLMYAVGSLILERHERLAALRRALVVAGVYAATVAAVYAVILDEPVRNVLDYAGWSMEISAGYSTYMATGQRPALALGFVAVVAAAVLLHAWSLWRPAAGGIGGPRRPSGLRGRAVVALLCAAPVLFVTWKQGFTRQDGHEPTAFAAAFVYLALVLAGARIPGRISVPAGAVLAVLAAALIMAVRVNDGSLGMEALGRRLLLLPGRLADTVALASPEARAEAAGRIARRDREAIAAIAQGVPMIAGYRDFDLFAPEQALALVNPQAYRPRPVFQGYSAYTAALQDLNAAHVERAPAEFLVGIRAIDGRYPNLEDGSALAQILLQFCPEGWHGPRVGFRRAEGHLDMAEIAALDWSTVPLDRGGRIDLPAGVILGHVDIALSPLGRMLAALYRMPPIHLTVALSDGSERVVRLLPTGRRYPAVLSPWLEGASDIRALWTGDAAGRSVRSLRLDAPGLLVDAVTLAHAVLPWQHVAARCTVPAVVTRMAPATAIAYYDAGDAEIR